jgi:hypothetical protein
MSPELTFLARSVSAPEYVLALHSPSDNVAVLLRNRNREQTLQRITSAETVASSEFQRWIVEQNGGGSDVFISMNPLKEGACSRAKVNVKEIFHLYLDVDENAKAVLASVRNSEDTPPPNFIIDTSPGKFQVVWKIEGADIEQAESLLHSLANQFGSDKAATDATRVLRRPGFVNRKYPNQREFVVRALCESDRVYQLRDFTVPEDSPDAPRRIGDAHSATRALHGLKSQSEADWTYAKRALARGDEPEEVMYRIADYRASDKHDPQYYARITVTKAQLELHRTDASKEEIGRCLAERGAGPTQEREP